MANSRADELNTLDETTIATSDLVPVHDTTATELKSITKENFDKSIGEVLDENFTIVDTADETKKANFEASGISTGTTRTYTFPDESMTLTGEASTQTLTNKTIDPSSNTIDGDKLDVDFTPTNYTPTTTGVTDITDDADDLSAHLKGIDNKLAEFSTENRELFVPITYNGVSTSTNAYNAEVGDFAYGSLTSSQDNRFVFKTPDDLDTLTSIAVVVIPDATETAQWDVTTDFGAAGEDYNNHSDSYNGSLAVTVSEIAELPVTDAFTSLAAGDYAGMVFNSNTSNLRVIGMIIKYTVAAV